MESDLSALVLLLPLAFSLISGFKVTQPETQQVNQDDSVTIACEVNGSEGTWTIDTKLKKKTRQTVVCKTSTDLTSFSCTWRKQGNNLVLFTLYNLKPSDYKDTYVCEVSRMLPLPVKIEHGNGTRLGRAQFSGTEMPLPSCPPMTTLAPQCTELRLLDWVLIGLVGILSLACLSITCAYVRLRRMNEVDDSLTYVLMQPPPHQNGNRQGGDPDSNTTYMDMRKTASNGRASGRDMNYNSHQVIQ